MVHTPSTSGLFVIFMISLEMQDKRDSSGSVKYEHTTENDKLSVNEVRLSLTDNKHTKSGVFMFLNFLFFIYGCKFWPSN